MIFNKTLQLLISSLSKKSTITFLLMKRASLTQSQDSHLNFEEKPCFDFQLITFSNISPTNYLIIYLFYILYKQSFYSFIFPLLISILKCLTFFIHSHQISSYQLLPFLLFHHLQPIHNRLTNILCSTHNSKKNNLLFHPQPTSIHQTNRPKTH